jgi:hypothetical protein
VLVYVLLFVLWVTRRKLAARDRNGEAARHIPLRMNNLFNALVLASVVALLAVAALAVTVYPTCAAAVGVLLSAPTLLGLVARWLARRQWS